MEGRSRGAIKGLELACLARCQSAAAPGCDTACSPPPDPGQSCGRARQKLVSAQSVYGKQQAGAPRTAPPLLYTSLSPESPFELLFWRPRRGHVDGEQELFEIYEPIFVRVKGAEDVVAELLCVAAREEQLVHVNELGRGQPAIGAVLLEALIPLLDCVLVVARVRLQELKVLLAQSLLALNAAHAACP